MLLRTAKLQAQSAANAPTTRHPLLPAGTGIKCGAALAVAVPAMLGKCWLLTRGIGRDGRLTYVPAKWRYDKTAKFDNSWPTWSTDYVIAALMTYQLQWLWRASKPSRLRIPVALLLFFYWIATTLGGLAHQLHDGTHFALNRAAFRVPWAAVVGATAMAGMCQGMIGSEVLRLGMNAGGPCSRGWPVSVLLPDATWLMWGALQAALVISGTFSHMRPACDTFIAGATQALPTFYMQAALWANPCGISRRTWWLLMIGLVSNSPLIFVYPWLVQHSGLQLGTINAILHSVVGTSWGAQGLGLVRMCVQIEAEKRRKGL
eukprot:gnl/TRDRNA2_/TRDRNA2_94051_c0_seq1.p1 gnl/TRDRNA2_/TRDRNA2_94051_c0~~gnl/TRDRNA2_/TRDRNA2_94051_c0_seq1.p1  ORF type:complete len:318 (+),score=26.61 gnl/TRDRNA2_/TRDRNA2_94051_c0_seq1:79-1032(+)